MQVALITSETMSYSSVYHRLIPKIALTGVDIRATPAHGFLGQCRLVLEMVINHDKVFYEAFSSASEA
ncbi:hypothetical protein FSARC_8465 [Fusarium sarcochroum]|uniref:Uncharacterized protein n=1 Tax=Fusarium sarcochroum TaxID=1208366 RepID=A0A8H4X6A9_9HYPO|nr:hypothetical protein FSARC_8465 [Fusarium sarcochroum]